MPAPGVDPVQTVTRFFRALDDRDYGTLAALLADDGEWHRQGAVLRNEADILAAMEKRSSTMRIHHLLSNLFAEPRGDNEAEVTGYMLVVRHDAKVEPTGPSPLSGIENIRTTRAHLRQTSEGWRIVRLAGDPPSFAAS
jgi:ketosteroid isomerase-like protein